MQKALDEMVDAFTDAIYGEWFTYHPQAPGSPPVPRASAESFAISILVESANRRNLPEGNLAREKMSTLLIIVILLLLFGGGGGYYAYGNYGGTGLGGVLGTVLVILLILWLLGVLR